MLSQPQEVAEFVAEAAGSLGTACRGCKLERDKLYKDKSANQLG
jgi:hypothetical protein